MSCSYFKLSALTLLVLGATSSNAALYRVVEVTATGEEVYGSAVQSVTASNYLGCFSSTTCSAGSYSFGGDTRESFDGFSYRQEVPFGIDNRFYYQDQDDLENYCDNELGYSTCESWASNRWFGDTTNAVGGLYRERQAWNLNTYKSNASGFVDSSSIASPDSPLTPTSTSFITGSKDVVINKLDGSKAIGNTSSGYFSNGTNTSLVYRSRGFYDSTLLLPKQQADGANAIVEQMGQTMAFDSFVDANDGKTYVVGSGSVAPYNYTDGDKDYLGDVGNCINYAEPMLYAECQNYGFATKPFVWDVSAAGSTATGVSASLWSDIGSSSGADNYSTANQDDYSAQSSIRAAVVPSGTGTYQNKPVLVGYNTHLYSSRLLMQAAVFYPNSTYDASGVVENAWNTTFITNATVRIDGDYIHSNSVAKDINNNLLVIGEAKRYGNKPESGSANNRLFIADASTGSPSATFFSGGIFFSGAGGEANAINNYNEIVGQIDAEDNREIGGKIRRKRAFIYPYQGNGSDSDRMAIFSNKAWWIDDLTNGGDYSAANNQYRVINAADINDDGVIAATALKCVSGEYDSTSHNAYCGGGSGEEKIVAVKLIPIADASSDDIVARSGELETVKRKGGSFGLLALTLLGLISFRRNR